MIRDPRIYRMLSFKSIPFGEYHSSYLLTNRRATSHEGPETHEDVYTEPPESY